MESDNPEMTRGRHTTTHGIDDPDQHALAEISQRMQLIHALHPHSSQHHSWRTSRSEMKRRTVILCVDSVSAGF